MKFNFYLLFTCIVFYACNSGEDKSKLEATSSDVVRTVSIKDVEQGIRANIEDITRKGNGYFNFQKDSFDLSLKLVRVHTEYLSVLGPNRYFACVDLATVDGDVYDVDFFMEGTADSMTVVRKDMHKLNGKPYYTWKQAEDNTWLTVPMAEADNLLLGIIEGEDEFSFNYTIEIPKNLQQTAKIWIPIASTDEFQKVEIAEVVAPTDYKMISDQQYGNQIMYLEIEPNMSGSEISIKYQVKRFEKSAYEDSTVDLDPYLAPSPLLPVGDRFADIANQAIKDREANNTLSKARALYDYVIDEVRYAKQGVYGTGDANYACDSKSGNCTEFHSLFISLARSAGIPARFAVGAAIPSSRNEGGVDGYHCWAEFYAEGKWWPVDISEADKYSTLSTYYFGHHPANRIELSRGRNIKPEIMPETGPINFLAYPIYEVNGELDKPALSFSFER